MFMPFEMKLCNAIDNPIYKQIQIIYCLFSSVGLLTAQIWKIFLFDDTIFLCSVGLHLSGWKSTC